MKIFKNKRGIVIENAIVFMLVIFAICFMLTSLTLVNYHQTKIETSSLETKFRVDQIGEDFLASIKSIAAGEDFSQNYGDYNYEYEYSAVDDVYRLTVKWKSATKLYVEATLDNTQNVHIICWQYL